jgi:hypothetical protein
MENKKVEFMGEIQLERLMILASGVQIPLWDVGDGLSDETI